MEIYKLILFAFGAFFNSVMDTLQHHHSTSIFKHLPLKHFFGKNNWARKYEYDLPFLPDSVNQWLFGGPLVFVTDGWHLAQWMMLNCISLACVDLSMNWPDILVEFLAYRIAWGLTFEIFYSWVWIKK